VHEHDDEQEEHHDPAGIDQDLHRADELRLLEEEDAGHEQEARKQEKSGVDRVLRDDDRDRRPERQDGQDGEHDAGRARQKRARHGRRGLRRHPRSTTVKGLTFSACTQSVSLRMSR
jgi:hypothetical protein